MAKKSVRNRYVYMAVTGDKFEIPICEADTLEKLGRMVGRSANAISSAMSRDRRGLRKRRYNVELRFVKIMGDGASPNKTCDNSMPRIHRNSVSGQAVMQALEDGVSEKNFDHSVDATRFAKRVRNAIYYHELTNRLWVEQSQNMVRVHRYE